MNEASLSHEELEHWHRRGYVRLPDLLPGDARERLSAWSDEIVALPAGRVRQQADDTQPGPAACCSERFLEHHAPLARLLTSGRLPAAVTACLGAPAAPCRERLYHDPPGAGAVRAHQDAATERVAGRRVTCLVAIDDLTPENGCLEFASPAPHLLRQDAQGNLPEDLERALGWRPVRMAAGEVLLFHAFVPHRFGPNRGATWRRVLDLGYCAEPRVRARYTTTRSAAG